LFEISFEERTFQFHVDVEVRRNLLRFHQKKIGFTWVASAWLGSRCFHCSMGSDLSQPTSTSYIKCII